MVDLGGDAEGEVTASCTDSVVSRSAITVEQTVAFRAQSTKWRECDTVGVMRSQSMANRRRWMAA